MFRTSPMGRLEVVEWPFRTEEDDPAELDEAFNPEGDEDA